jgi:pimeloyl-ACP methyl ester carboxylesterase
MSLEADDIETQAKRLVETDRRPVRRARPRLARKLYEAEDLEVQTPAGPVMAWRLGVGPATLMVHGWEDDNALWSPLIDACAAIGRAVVVLDLPGHGYSQAEECNVQTAGKAAIAVAEALGPIDSVVCHSFGCGATIWALANGLRAGRAALIASAVPRTKGGRRTFDEWRQRRLDEGEAPEVVDRAVEILTARSEVQSPGAFDVEAALKAMTDKAIIIHSMDDEQCPVGNAQAIVRHWQGSELVLVDGLGHRLIAQEDDVLQRIVDFFEGFE